MREAWEWEWFNSTVSVLRVEDSRGIVGRVDGKIAGMCVLDNCIEGSAQMHLAIVNPMILRHGFREACFNAAFGEERQRVLGWVPSVNHRALKFNKHLGFTEVARIHEGYCPGVDYILMQLARKDCTYLGE